ncbi:MAG: OmpH family outer membrane protein [Gammaproteobacteria bacterium]|jgi:outer membrane protein
MKAMQIIACAMLMLVTGAAYAQTAKIGVVNFGRLLDESPQAQASQRALQDEFAPRQRELRGREEQLKSLEDRLTQSEGFMSEEERQNLEREARDLQRELNRGKSEFGEDLSLRRNEELGKLQRMLVEEVQSVASAQGYDIVLSEAVGVVYASTGVDLTDQILSALQARNAAGAGGN